MELWLILAAVVAVFWAAKKVLSKKEVKPPEPPTTTVYMLGCNGRCGYFIPDFEAGDRMVYCQYQKKTVKQGSDCPFKDDHPDLVRKGSFDI